MATVPSQMQSYLALARVDRPIGSWLLLFPCWWSLALAELSRGQVIPNPTYLLLFVIGAFVMRGAGCTWNDIIDRDIDAKVARTANRPVASGAISVPAAVVFACVLSLIGLAVLLNFNRYTIGLAIASLGLVLIYPFAKRFTYWPQLVLGLGFNWGALVGWTAITGALAPAPIVLYAGAVSWTLGYDTIYAHQDRGDDLKAGVKSTALRFGETSAVWISGFYALALGLWAAAGYLAGARSFFFVGLALAAAHFVWQVRTLNINDAKNCLVRFKSNRTIGIVIFLGICAELLQNLR